MCDKSHWPYVYWLMGIKCDVMEFLCKECWTLLGKRDTLFQMVLLELTLSSFTSASPDLVEVPLSPNMTGPPSDETQMPKRSEYASR